MTAFVRAAFGWALLLLVLFVAARIVAANPQGSAQLVKNMNARVGTFASTAASQLPDPSPGTQQASPAAVISPHPAVTVTVTVPAGG